MIMGMEETGNILDQALKNSTMSPELREMLEKAKTTNAEMIEKAKLLPRVNDYETTERRRSLVVIGMAESNEQKPSARQESDLRAVQSLMDELDVEANKE